MKALIWGNVYFGKMWCLERTDVGSFPIWEDVVILKLLILHNLYAKGMVVFKGLICFQFSIWEGVVDLKGLILDNFHFQSFGGLERTDFGLVTGLALPNHNV